MTENGLLLPLVPSQSMLPSLRQSLSVAVCFFSLLLALGAQASEGLTIYASEFGVGKFHRYDNQVHAYDPQSSWTNYILPTGANSDPVLSQKNSDGSYTIFYSTLEEMIQTSIHIATTEQKPISVLNIHGHGLPGAMWFPMDAAALNSGECAAWRQAASGQDADNYRQYYSAVSVDDIMQIRRMSNLSDIGAFVGCITTLSHWKKVIARNPQVTQLLARDAQIHFASCVVGLGKAGELFTTGIAELLLAKGPGRVTTSTNFGLGDWSMPEGMGFWDYQSASQVDKDNANYVAHKKDREIAQKGTLRIVSLQNDQWKSTLLANQDFMPLSFTKKLQGKVVPEAAPATNTLVPPNRVRIPGTSSFVVLRKAGKSRKFEK